MTDPAPPPYAFAGLDRIFHERARLGIVTLLAGQPAGVTFTDLKRLCGLTDGNLSRHLQSLEDAGYLVARREEGRDGRQLTRYLLTALGRDRFMAYLTALEGALREAADAVKWGGSPAPAAG